MLTHYVTTNRLSESVKTSKIRWTAQALCLPNIYMQTRFSKHMSQNQASQTNTLMPNGHGGRSISHMGAMLLLALMWGLSIPITKLGLESLPPLTLTALRFAFAVPPMLIFASGRLAIPKQALPRVAALGLLGIGIGQVAQTFGVAGTSASVGTIISATIPLFIVVFASMRLGQRVSQVQACGLLLAFVGLALVAVGGTGNTSTAVDPGTTIAGAVWMLLSSLAIAFYYVWSVELTNAYGTATVAAWSTTFGFLALLPWTGWEMWHTSIQLSLMGVGAALYLGVVVTVAGLFMWLNLLRVVPARVAASVQYLQPIFGVAAASILLGDHLGLAFVIGALLVLLGLGTTMSSR